VIIVKIHYIDDQRTKCGLTSLDGQEDNYTQDIEDCTCPVCLRLVVEEINRKLPETAIMQRARLKYVEQNIIVDALEAASTVERILNNGEHKDWDFDELHSAFIRCGKKIDGIDVSDPQWHVELKRRLLQNAALSVALIRIIDTLQV
jgi:hypothetical protein